MSRSMLCVLLLALAGCTVSSPREMPSERSAVSAIDQALLMSELFALGIRSGVEQKLGERADASQIGDCLHAKVAPATRAAFAHVIADGMSEEDLKRGGELASAPVFAKLAPYIRANRESMRVEANGTGGRVDHYFLHTSAARLNVPKAESAEVDAFIAWHSTVVPHLNEQLLKAMPPLLDQSRQFIEECLR